MTNRLTAPIERVRTHPNLPNLPVESVTIGFREHAAYQTQQSQAFAAGKMSFDEAQLIYQALGEIWSEENTGWAAGTDTATKVVVIRAIAELLGVEATA